jgi:hypothetical protein
MMNRLKSSEKRLRAQQAKEFLISQIVEEAQRENVSLSEVERKMLYFTETEETLPDIYEINDQFERDYDGPAYEKKIAALLRDAYRRICSGSPEGKNRWKQAICDLRGEDHYLLVMLAQSREPDVAWWVPILWGIGISILLFVLMVAEETFDPKGIIPGWLFGWVSNDRQAQKLEYSLIFYGLFGFWLVVRLAKAGVLGEVTKTIYNSITSNFSFLRVKRRSPR